MRRDEVRLFRGNVETHVRRLGEFPDQPQTAAREHPPAYAHLGSAQLDYAALEIERAERWKRWMRRLEQALQAGVILMVALPIFLLIAVGAGPDFPLVLLVLLILALVTPGIWLMIRLVNWWRGEG